MATYIVTGDSWSMGEFVASKTPVANPLQHRGLVQLLEESGHTAYHVGRPGFSNWDSTKMVAAFLDRHDVKIDAIIACQIGFEKDLGYQYSDKDWSQVRSVGEVAGWYLWDYYQKLNDFYDQLGIPTFLIGSKCDTMWFDDLSDHLPGLTVVCQSLFNWVVNDNDRIEKPVYSWFDRTTIDLVQQLHKNMNSQGVLDLLDNIDLGMQREVAVRTNREYFWPDGEHPNMQAWKKVYKLLTDRGHVLIDQ